MCRFNFKVRKVAQKLGWVKTLTNKSQGLQYTHARTTMAKFLNLCDPNSNPNPKKIFGMWIHI